MRIRSIPKAETKYILRESLKGVLPTAVYERKDKKGFVAPGRIEMAQRAAEISAGCRLLRGS
jgi:hypothetical protein